MKDYYIKEWTMRVLAILTVTFMSLWGCQTFQKSEPMPQMEVTRITPEPVVERELTFIEVLRKACLEDGFFKIKHQGVEEVYDCQKRQG
jgi:hypothetical protein